MASTSKLPSGAWRALASKNVNGKRVRKSFTVDPSECEGNSRKAKLMAERMANDWLIDEEVSESFVSVEKAIDLYIKDRTKVISESTLSDYYNMSKHFKSILNKDIKKISTKTLQAMINEMAFDKLSPGTIKNRISFLISALKYNGVDKSFNVKYPKRIAPNLPPPEPSEFHRLMEMATPEEKLTIILAGLYTLRRGEIGGLCGEDILWDMNAIYVHSSRVLDPNREWVRREMPKNLTSVRRIQIDPKIMELFPKVGAKEYVISMNPNQITKHFEQLRSKACVTCRFHDLRKYAASIRSEIMPMKFVEADGGWRKGSNVLRTIYDKPFAETRNEYSKILNQKIVDDYGKELFS